MLFYQFCVLMLIRMKVSMAIKMKVQGKLDFIDNVISIVITP